MRREIAPGVIVAAAVALSVGLHLGGVVTLDVATRIFHLAERLRRPPTVRGIEIAFEVPPVEPVASSAAPAPEAQAPVVVPAPLPATRAPEPEPEPERSRARPPAAPRQERPRPARPRPERPRPEPVETPPPVPAEPRQLAADQHFIEQRSDDPSVPPPENPRFLAPENRRVEEETVATVRNLVRDDQGTPSPGRPRRSRDTAVGSDDDERAADLRDREGDDRRAATPTEAEQERPVRSAARLPDARARGDQRAPGPLRGATERPEQEPSRRARAETPRVEPTPPGPAPSPGAAGTPAPAAAPTPAPVASDAQGALALATQPQVVPGPTGAGGVQQGPAPAPSRGAPEPARGQSGRGRGIGRRGPDLRVTWDTFEETFGTEQLREEREAYARERRSRSRGSYAGRWTRFRGAIENYVPFVRPGNQTALSAAASPFASYLSGVHRRIHRFFADDFLASLDSLGADHSLNDPSLVTRLEIILNRDGTVHRVGVAATSGMLPFDFGAVDSVHRGAPFPAAPETILSGDGRVYMHWSFYRNTRACGTFNAEPYILPRPGERPRPGGAPGPTEDRPPPGRRSPTPADLRDDRTGTAPAEPRPRGG